MEIIAAQTRSGRIAGLYATPDSDFPTAPVDTLELTFAGIAGDRHEGMTRASGAREPWYPRGTEMRNERQLTILAPDELNEIADGMDLPEVKPEWIGGNILIDGVARLSMLPAGTLLMFEGGVTLAVQGQNAPCRVAGGSIARHFPDRQGLDLSFPKVAKRLRGLVAWVEKPGTLSPGEGVTARIPEQWIYGAGG